MLRVSMSKTQPTARNSRLRGALRLCIPLIYAITAPVAAAPSNASVSLICGGVQLQVSVELYYRFPNDGGLGVMRTPDLRLTRELKDCSLEELYQQLLIRPDIVLRHATGERPVTALTQNDNATAWRQVSDFRTIKLQNGMRVSITLFNTPAYKPLQKGA